jgi:hypothetical protein
MKYPIEIGEIVGDILYHMWAGISWNDITNTINKIKTE